MKKTTTKHHSFRTNKKGDLLNLELKQIDWVSARELLKHKMLHLKNAEKIEVFNYTLKKIKDITQLLQPNEHILVTMDLIKIKNHDYIVLKIKDKNGDLITETITKTYRKTFNKEYDER